MLDKYRVVDLSDERGLLCGSLLADLGAEVIRVEPPGGSTARVAAPAGALWEAWARNTSSVTVDMADAGDLETLRRLISRADFLVESGEPGWLQPYGLDFASVERLNPAIVYVSITPFGTTGPRADDPATDLTVQAASGSLFDGGTADRPPLRTAGNHSWAHAGAEAASAALIAHHARRRSGVGQHVDVSGQEAFSLAAGFRSFAHLLNATVAIRSGDEFPMGPVTVPTIFRAADGFVVLAFLFGPTMGPYARRLMEWIHEEGECDAETRDKDWVGYIGLLASGEEPRSELDRVLGIVSRFVEARSVQTLFDEVRKRQIMLVPANSLAHVFEDEHAHHRGAFWRATDLPGTPLVHGPMAKFSRTPLSYRRRAPALGEHTAMLTTSERPPTPWGSGQIPERALDDLKVLDFSWLMAGPWTTRVLADYGATVLKIESEKRKDAIRMAPPFRDDVMGDQNSQPFHSVAAGKMSLGLDLTTDEGRKIALELVEWADIVVESFSPKAMSNWGLDYEHLRAVKPDIIMLSSSLFGQTGPNALLPGVGIMGSAVSGITAMTGWPGEKVTGPWGAYTDFTAPRISVLAILAAIDHRRSTGEGQYIDLSQVETGYPWIAPELLDYSVDGHQFTPDGNGHPAMAPHSVYPSAGDDKWIAIAARDDRDWVALCRAIDQPELADDPRLGDVDGRRAHAEHIDEIVAAWTRTRDAREAERTLVQHGVPASAVVDPYSFPDEVQFRHRGHVVTGQEPSGDPIPFESTHTILSRTPAQTRWAGPSIGQHTDVVLGSILGYDDRRIAELRSSGVIRPPSRSPGQDLPPRRGNA
jgi:crotonobetainyl-CoA:carnitine CoA-transferase CaiB-like acyl-CoA transferase